jgi:hypothetical protein
MDGSCFENDFGRTGFSLSVFFRVFLRSQKSTKTLMLYPQAIQNYIKKNQKQNVKPRQAETCPTHESLTARPHPRTRHTRVPPVAHARRPLLFAWRDVGQASACLFLAGCSKGQNNTG